MHPASLKNDPSATAEDRDRVARAYAIARSAVRNGNHPFGALLARGQEVLFEVENEVVTTGDVTRHAETGLIAVATARLGADALDDTTLFTSTEPCIMCVGAIHWAGVRRVVYGVTSSQMSSVIGRPYRGIPCREAFERVGASIEVTGPVGESEGLEIHREFWPKFLRDRDPG